MSTQAPATLSAERPEIDRLHLFFRWWQPLNTIEEQDFDDFEYRFERLALPATEHVDHAGHAPAEYRFEQMRNWPPETFAARPELLDWLVPADDFFHPDSAAPRLAVDGAGEVLTQGWLQPLLLSGYFRFLHLAHLAHDVDGMLRPGRGQASPAQRTIRELLTAPRDESKPTSRNTRLARRVGRFLQLSSLERCPVFPRFERETRLAAEFERYLRQYEPD